MESNYVSFYDISIATLWLVIFLVIANSRARKVDATIRKYYLRNVFFKFFFAISFAIVYLIYYGGGDTTAYWDGAVTLNNLFMNSPSLYFENLITEPSSEIFSKHFSLETGYPPVGCLKSLRHGLFVKLLQLCLLLHLNLILLAPFFLHF